MLLRAELRCAATAERRPAAAGPATAPSEPAPNLGAVVHYVDDSLWENDAAFRGASLLWHGPCAKIFVERGGRWECGVEP